MSEIKRLSPYGDSYELTDEDRRVIGCFRAVGMHGEGASHGEKAMVNGMEALIKAADILYSCDPEQRAIICEAFRQHMVHDGMYGNKARPNDIMDRRTRFHILQLEGDAHFIDASK